MDCMPKGIGYYTRVIHNQLERKANAYLRELGLTQTQGYVLRFIVFAKQEERKIKQKDIEDYFHISNPTVSGLLDRLEQKNLIVRTKAPSDKRIHYIEPTEQGIALQNAMIQNMRKTEEEMLRGIDPKTVENGLDFLDQILSNLDCEDSES